MALGCLLVGGSRLRSAGPARGIAMDAALACPGRRGGARLLRGPRHAQARHRLLHHAAQDPDGDGREMGHARGAEGQYESWVRPAARRALLHAAAPAGPGAGSLRRAGRGGLRGRAEQQPDPPGAKLLRSPARHPRQKPHGLYRAPSRHHAPRPAEPRSRAAPGAARLLPPRQPHRARDGRAGAARPAAPRGRDRTRDGHDGRLRPVRSTP